MEAIFMLKVFGVRKSINKRRPLQFYELLRILSHDFTKLKLHCGVTRETKPLRIQQVLPCNGPIHWKRFVWRDCRSCADLSAMTAEENDSINHPASVIGIIVIIMLLFSPSLRSMKDAKEKERRRN
jgi:hypothetical protein